MTWYAWVLVGVFVARTIATIAVIGKPCQPYTPTDAVAALILNALGVWAVLALAGAA